jgi:class 3 adenylate cyclase
VTLLLADVEASTRLWDTVPSDMTAAIAALDRTLSDAIAAHDGVRPIEQGGVASRVQLAQEAARHR